MGDFNADMERYIAKNKLATKGKYRILLMLLDKGLYDTQKVTCTNNLHHTWFRMKIHYEESIIFGFQKG